MDSSPDLSLKLRRGSSDSRDSFYMDFAQGIDSDIEEVDTTINQRATQELPPLPEAVIPVTLPLQLAAPPPPIMSLASQPLPTLSESDDLPQTPPPHIPTTAPRQPISSPPPPPPLFTSPTSSVREILPPPPLSPPLSAAAVARLAPPSPPAETEDEGDEDDDDDGDDEPLAAAIVCHTVDEDDAGNADDVDEGDETGDDEKSSPPPPLAPLPSNLSYVHGNGVHGHPLSVAPPVTPPLTKSPSTSPSPPDTPPPCPKPKSLGRIVSPPPPMKMQPLTPPSESDQSQPNSPPPLPHHAMNMLMSTPPKPSSPKGGESLGDVYPTTPPPEFGEADEIVAAALAAAVEASANELMCDGQPQWEQGKEESKSQYDDESTTITTPPSNGYSGSSIMLPAGLADHLGELEADARLILDDIPPPEEMNEPEPEEEEEVGDDETGSKTPISEQPEEQTTEDIQADDEEGVVVSMHSTPTPQATPSASVSPKPVVEATGSRGPSRSVSRSGSRSGSSRNASRSGSARGSNASRAASIASGAGVPVAASPPISVKSLRSPPSTKSSLSKKSPQLSAKGSPPPTTVAHIQSPLLADSPPAMPSPPLMRSPLAMKSPPAGIHSPPQVASPPKVHSPQLVQADQSYSFKPTSGARESTDTADSQPTTSAAPSTLTTAAKAASVATAAAALTSLSYQDEHTATTRPHLSSHHHYHLPHHFQHPHHQNHHTHGSVPVPTPTIPASFKVLSIGGDVMSAMGGDGGGGPRRSPSPPTAAAAPIAATTATTSSLLLSTTESVTHVSAVSPAKSATRLSQHRVTIDESSLPISSSSTHRQLGSGGGGGGDSSPPSPGSSSHQQLARLSADGGGSGEDRQTGHLALMYHSHQLTSYPVLPAIKRTHRPSFVYPPMPRIKAGDALATLFSALYGKLLVVMGIAFPMAEVISTYIPPSFYEVYYLYLYIGSMIFLFFMYATLLWGRPKIPINIPSPTKSKAKTRHSTTSGSSDLMDESDTDSNSTRNKTLPPILTSARRPSLLAPLGRQHHYGSFYLRMGAVAFGIGSMIYSGLEFGQYFELNPDTKCHNVLLALTPATRMAFIFIQMYFIFLNNEQIKVYRYKIIARFGLMHMIGTNLAVWLNVLIQETKHEILTFYNPENRTLRISHRIPGHSRGHAVGHVIAVDPTAHLRVPRGLKGPYQIFECRRTNIIGTLVQDASPFLFPCTIEYSLICAAILYVMWRSISRPQSQAQQRPDPTISPMKRSPHHYSVDCARAHKGLFVGILILVLTIISLILFFVLISRPDFVSLAVTEVTICELLIYGTATIATLVGMIQIRVLQYDAYRSFSLDDILLVGAQTGSFLYNIFTVIAGHFTLRSDDMLVPLNALASIVQTACQTMFILDASRRQAASPEHIRKKPGREIVTFMLVVNLAMWAISTLEKSRAESHPIQLNFYGLWAWTIITHVSMPLAIFYRFHSTVCLCEIWKRAYKLKPTYM